MGYISTWKDAKTLGRPQAEPEKEGKVEIEMKTVTNESEEKQTSLQVTSDVEKKDSI